MFSGIKVWRLCWQVEDLDPLRFQPLLGSFRGMLWVIILLKDNALLRDSGIFHSRKQIILQNGDILLSIHPPFHLCKDSHSIPTHAPPNHQGTSSKLYCPLYFLVMQSLSC